MTQTTAPGEVLDFPLLIYFTHHTVVSIQTGA